MVSFSDGIYCQILESISLDGIVMGCVGNVMRCPIALVDYLSRY